MHKTANKTYDRSSDGDYILKSDEQLKQIYNRKSTEYSENKIYPFLKLKHFADGTIDKVRKMIKINRPNHPWNSLSNNDFFRISGLYREDLKTGEEGFTLSALLLFGKPEAINSAIPHYKIDALLRIKNIDRYDDRINIKHNLIESYDRLMAFVEKHLSDKFYLEGTQRISLRDKIFREIIVNMLIHREYLNAFPSSFIIYKDKVVTKNANKAHHFGKLEPGNYQPFPKNPDIANIFTQMGYSEELGTGIKNVYKYTKPYSGKDSVLFNEEDIFITHIPLKELFVEQLEYVVNDPLNDPLNERQKQIIEIIKHNNKITKDEVAHKVDTSLETIKRDFRVLIKYNYIKHFGSKKTGYWKVL